MEQRLFLLDGMALAYRAHFAFITRPIRTSTGVNTSALFGFANTLIELIENQKPTHMAVVFDTSVPTARHELFPEYKAHREEMPEDLSVALPQLDRFAEAFGVPVLRLDGYEADDIIGTLARLAEPAGFTTYMVTPDKDFGQLVSERVFIYKPGYKGEAPEILGVPEVLARWEIKRVAQVIDMLGLIGDTSDNIPGVPGVGPKTAVKLIGEYDTLENLLANADSVKGRMSEKLQQFAEQARLSKQLATIDRHVPLDPATAAPEILQLGRADVEKLRALCAEFEFRTLAARALTAAAPRAGNTTPASIGVAGDQGELFPAAAPLAEAAAATPSEAAAVTTAPGQLDLGVVAKHRTLTDVPHHYEHVTTAEARAALAEKLRHVRAFCFDTETDGLEARHAPLCGFSLCWEAGLACFVRLPAAREEAIRALEVFRPAFADPAITKIGHNLKFDLAALKNHGVDVAGPLFDTMLAHALVEPDQRHAMDYLSEIFLDYSPIPLTRLIGDGKDAPQICVTEVDPTTLAEYGAEDADVTWQLRDKIAPLLRERGQERVFHEIEAPLVRVLVDMEHEGVALDTTALAAFGQTLEHQAATMEKQIVELAGRPFNLNSPKQLGEILFDELRLAEKPKKTRTGQYATNEQTLQTLAGRHPIVQAILDYREITKLKGTYVDALPAAVDPVTKRVHTHFGQLRAATGRLNSDNPNLQNIPIRTEQGREIRRAFIARGDDWRLLSADYSQIELRIIAALSEDAGMLEAFARGDDIHTATAAKIFSVAPAAVTREQRARAKMVNFGIPYGISSFGLAQRLGIPRSEADDLIGGYMAQFGGIQDYIDRTLEFARKHGYVETVTGRRRYLPDIKSANNTTKNAAERVAINMPIQGTAADMIKLAMVRIHDDLGRQGLRTKLLLQVHDELLFDLHLPEEAEVRGIVDERMRNALPLKCPIAIEIGTGTNWLEAH